jgi:hypothetical protein
MKRKESNDEMKKEGKNQNYFKPIVLYIQKKIDDAFTSRTKLPVDDLFFATNNGIISIAELFFYKNLEE